MKLNDTQRKLVEQNHPLIYLYMSLNNFKFDDPEDWYGVIAEAMCVAAHDYDTASLVPFWEFAKQYIDTFVQQVLDNEREFIYGDVSLNDLK